MSNIKTYVKTKSIITNVIGVIKRAIVIKRKIIAVETNKIIVTSDNKIISLGG